MAKGERQYLDIISGKAKGVLPAVARAHMGLYVYRRDTLLKLAALPAAPLELIESLEQLRAMADGIRIRVVHTPHLTAAVDTPADLERVRHLMLVSPRT